MKFLILGLVALTTVGVVFADDDTYYPVPVDDSTVSKALDSKKAQIILDVIQTYPNITHAPIFHINSVDKKIYETDPPPVVYYRINVTLAVFRDNPFNPSGMLGQLYTPIVTFNVTLRYQDFKTHQAVRVNSYEGIVLPHLPKPNAEPTKKSDYLGKPEEISVDSKHFWALYKSVEKDLLKHLKTVFAKESFLIPGAVLDDAIPQLDAGAVQYKNNHGDLDAPIVRVIVAKLYYLGRATPNSDSPRKKITDARITVALEERFNPLTSTISHELRQVDGCTLENGKCRFHADEDK